MNSTKSDEASALEKLKEVQHELCCSVCQDYFVQAVTLNCSHSFCNGCIAEWRENHDDCPCCRQMIYCMTPSRALDNMVAMLLTVNNSKVVAEENTVNISCHSTDSDNNLGNSQLDAQVEAVQLSDTSIDDIYHAEVFEHSSFELDISGGEWPDDSEETVEVLETTESEENHLNEEQNLDDNSYGYEAAEMADVEDFAYQSSFEQDSGEIYLNNEDNESYTDYRDVDNYPSDCDDYNNDHFYLSDSFHWYFSDSDY